MPRRKACKLVGVESISSAQEVYGESGALSYSTKEHLRETQSELSERVLQLLGCSNQRAGQMILDVGCGNGFSTGVAERWGHVACGTDISGWMLRLAQSSCTTKNACFLQHDMRHGLPFRYH